MKEIIPIALLGHMVTSTTTGTEKDLAYYYVSPGRREVMSTMSVINQTGVASDTGSVIVKLQSSATTVDTDFVDMSGFTFESVADTDCTTTASSNQVIYAGLPNDRYVRAVATVTGTPKFAISCCLDVVKRVS